MHVQGLRLQPDVVMTNTYSPSLTLFLHTLCIRELLDRSNGAGVICSTDDFFIDPISHRFVLAMISAEQ